MKNSYSSIQNLDFDFVKVRKFFFGKSQKIPYFFCFKSTYFDRYVQFLKDFKKNTKIIQMKIQLFTIKFCVFI